MITLVTGILLLLKNQTQEPVLVKVKRNPEQK